MLQFALSVKKIKNKLFLYLFPLVLYGVHSFLASISEVFPNYGVSFGVDLPMIELTMVCLLLFILINILKKPDWGLYLIFIGGLVNLVDRFLFSFVRDYFKVVFFYNNLADWTIFVGVFWYLINFYEKNRNNLRR